MMLADVSVIEWLEKPDKMVSRAIIVGMRELLTQYAHCLLYTSSGSMTSLQITMRLLLMVCYAR